MRLLNFWCLQRRAAVAQISLSAPQAWEHAALGNMENGTDGYFNLHTASGRHLPAWSTFICLAHGLTW